MIPPRTILNLFSAYRSYRAKRTHPLFFTNFITGRCNLNCPACFFKKRKMCDGNEEMSTKKHIEIAKQAADLHIPFYYVAGGEPLIRGDLFEIVASAKRRGLYTILYTNGTLIDKSAAGQIGRCFDTVFISLDGPRKIHDAWRQPGAHDRTMAGMESLRAGAPKVKMNVNTIIEHDSLGWLEGFVAKARSIGINRVQIHPNFTPPERISDDEVEEFHRALTDIKKRYPKVIEGEPEYFRRIALFFGRDNGWECDAATRLNIANMPGGVVSACCMYSAPIGDLKIETLKEVLARRRPADDLFSSCEGCCRQDYRLIRRLFSRPLISMTFEDFHLLKNL